MEARPVRAAVLAATLLVCMGASYRTPNFVVQTPDPKLAEQVGKAAEKYRRELALEWIGKAMPNWGRPCLMTVRVGPHLGSGGATTFVFDRGEVFGWQMTIQGSRQRLLDSVLPHEITHMIFASHFRRPVPRWADEGGATSVEHSSERNKYLRMLLGFLRSNRGIAFNNMYHMTNYPRDVLPLYSQGFSLSEFLIQLGGKRKFIEYIGDGMNGGQWSAATKRHYGITDLGTLQNTWLAWVRKGFPRIQPPPDSPQAAPGADMLAGGKRPRPKPNLIYHLGSQDAPVGSPGEPTPEGKTGRTPLPAEAVWTSITEPLADTTPKPATVVQAGWYPAGTRPIGRVNSPTPVPKRGSLSEPVRTQVAHPQPIQRSRQVILEWSKP